MLRFEQTPRALLQLVTAILLTSHVAAKPQPHPSEHAGFSFNELFARWDCAGTACGWTGQVCCLAGQACYTNSLNQAVCTPTTDTATVTGGSGGYWEYYTTTYVETDLVTRTSVMSSYIGVSGAAATSTGLPCNYALNETPCNDICCASGQYCSNPGEAKGQCLPAAGGGSSAYYSTYTTGQTTTGATAGAPIRPTTSAGKTVTTTSGPTTTIPFVTPVATGANITLTEDHMGGGGLSGGAIAGIVIGVIAGLLLLALILACCCCAALFDGLLACLGCGRKKRRSRTEVEEYERHSHHTSRHGGGGGRTWYGAAKPSTRVDRRESHHSKGKELLGVGAGLAALWAILGLKRKRDNRRNEEKYSEYSYSSDYYTSASSASSDDRRTRDTRHSRR